MKVKHCNSLSSGTSWLSHKLQTSFFLSFPFLFSTFGLLVSALQCRATGETSVLMRSQGRGGASRGCASTCPSAWASTAGHCIRQWCKCSKNDTQQQAQSDGHSPRFLSDQRLLFFAFTKPKLFSSGVTSALSRFDPPECLTLWGDAGWSSRPPAAFQRILCVPQAGPVFFGVLGRCAHCSEPPPRSLCFQGSSSASPPPAAPSGPHSRPQVKPVNSGPGPRFVTASLSVELEKYF